jgi:hypothetical protein
MMAFNALLARGSSFADETGDGGEKVGRGGEEGLLS